MKLRRITLAAALAIVPALRAAEANLDDWLHDNLSNRALWLYGSNNLALETAPAELPPRTPGKRWVLNRDGQPAAVVYFVPGDIKSVEVDTHRQPGAAGDFTLSVSPDGRIWQPLPSTVAALENGAGWEYRLLAADAVPAHQMHVRVEFPAEAKADTHRLTEVWIRFTWDASLLETDAPKPARDETSTTATSELKPTVSAEPATAVSPAREAIVVFGKPDPVAATASVATPPAAPAAGAELVRTLSPNEERPIATIFTSENAPATPVPPAPPADLPPAPAAETPVVVPSVAPEAAPVPAPPAGPAPVENSGEASGAPGVAPTPAEPSATAALEPTSSPSVVKVAKPAKKKSPPRNRIGPRSR